MSVIGVRIALSSVALGVSTIVVGCGPKAPEGPPVGISSSESAEFQPSEKVTHYAFDSLDDRPVASEVHRGKPTVIAFVATGDIVGQAQVSYLVHMAKNDGDEVNYAVVALHPRKEIVLVEAYRKTLGVEFPVALGDRTSTSASGPFGEISVVPTVVILDRAGKMVWKHTGLAKHDELRSRMRGL